MFGSAVEGLFSSDWKARETAVLHLSRESIPLLLPHIQVHQSRVPPINGGATGSGGNADNARDVQEVCMQVVTIAANDSVLKVFLAALVSADQKLRSLFFLCCLFTHLYNTKIALLRRVCILLWLTKTAFFHLLFLIVKGLF